MGVMKDFDIRIRNGGEDAAGAVNELMAELERRLLELQASMPCWIPVTERLPEEGERVLYYNGDCDRDYGRMVRIGVCIDDGPTGTREMRICELGRKDMAAPEHRATHWMPLPAPPITDEVRALHDLAREIAKSKGPKQSLGDFLMRRPEPPEVK